MPYPGRRRTNHVASEERNGFRRLESNGHGEGCLRGVRRPFVFVVESAAGGMIRRKNADVPSSSSPRP